MCIKLFRTVCWVALSVSRGLRKKSNSPERERRQRESKCERRGGCQFLIPIPHFKKVVGEPTVASKFQCQAVRAAQTHVIVFLPFSPLSRSLSVSVRMENAHTRESADVLSYFGVTEDTGLTPEQVKKNLDKYGFNGEGSKEMDDRKKQLGAALQSGKEE